MFFYFLQVFLLQLIFILYFDLFLQNQNNFERNRGYLLFTFTLTFLLPLINLPLPLSLATIEKSLIDSVEFKMATIHVQTVKNTVHDILSFWLIVYMAGITIGCFRFLFKIFTLNQWIKNGKKIPIEPFVLVINNDKPQIFSIYKFIFVDKHTYKNHLDLILLHETVHLKKKHWIDLLFFEVVKIFLWFDPFIDMYMKRIKMIHEFIADREVLQHINLTEYFQFLLESTFQVNNISFTNSLKTSQLKKRMKIHDENKKAGAFSFLFSFIILIFLC